MNWLLCEWLISILSVGTYCLVGQEKRSSRNIETRPEFLWNFSNSGVYEKTVILWTRRIFKPKDILFNNFTNFQWSLEFHEVIYCERNQRWKIVTLNLNCREFKPVCMFVQKFKLWKRSLRTGFKSIRKCLIEKLPEIYLKIGL